MEYLNEYLVKQKLMNMFMKTIGDYPPELETIVSGYAEKNAITTEELLNAFKKELGDENFNAYKGTATFDTLFNNFSLQFAKSKLSEYYQYLIETMKNWVEVPFPEEVINEEDFVNLMLIATIEKHKGAQF
jgi:hypothetical protein